MVANLAVLSNSALYGATPVVPAAAGSKLLFVAVWGWVVPVVWGLSAKWLPSFLGLAAADERLIKISALLNPLACILYVLSLALPAQLLVLLSASSFVAGLKIFGTGIAAAKTQGLH